MTSTEQWFVICFLLGSKMFSKVFKESHYFTGTSCQEINWQLISTSLFLGRDFGLANIALKKTKLFLQNKKQLNPWWLYKTSRTSQLTSLISWDSVSLVELLWFLKLFKKHLKLDMLHQFCTHYILISSSICFYFEMK